MGSAARTVPRPVILRRRNRDEQERAVRDAGIPPPAGLAGARAVTGRPPGWRAHGRMLPSSPRPWDGATTKDRRLGMGTVNRRPQILRAPREA